ncbi:putative ethylene-responsive binding factor-associated repression, Ninja family [Dioscorea sansibarensis]
MAAEAVEEEMERFSGRRHGYPRDLLQRLGSTTCYEEKEEFVRRDLDEIELSLGLSLGGCFGEETIEKGGLVRSSSIASMSMSMTGRKLEFTVVKGIARASSLPAGTDEELRKRKEIQSLKRLEAKRKRLERRTSRSMVGVGRDRSEESVEEEVERSGVELGGGLPPALTRWPANGPGGLGPVSQRSIGSQGSCSSGVSELDARVMQGLNSRSAHSIKPRSDGTNHKIATIPATVGGKRINCSREGEDPMRRHVRTQHGLSEMEKSMMQEMPCVSTRGDGPDGRRIEGFLYRYRKGEDVRIVCICHGRFLTPAEFVKHAGGGDVAHPLRHIVVSQFPSACL